MAQLFDAKIPAVLITAYTSLDSNLGIRRYRQKIPVLRSRDEIEEPEELQRALIESIWETKGNPPPARKPHRCFIRVVGLEKVGADTLVEVFVPDWSSRRAVSFPLDLVPAELHPLVRVDEFLVAKVNINAARPEDLYFSEFQIAPTVDSQDGLA